MDFPALQLQGSIVLCDNNSVSDLQTASLMCCAVKFTSFNFINHKKCTIILTKLRNCFYTNNDQQTCCILILSETSALYKSFTYLLTLAGQFFPELPQVSSARSHKGELLGTVGLGHCAGWTWLPVRTARISRIFLLHCEPN